MAVLARYHKQRRVQRGAWVARFTQQRRNYRGSTKPTAPTLASISPTSHAVGEDSTDFTITCTGTGFVTGVTVITINGLDQPTTFVSATSVTCPFDANNDLVSTTKSVNVRNGPLLTATPKTLTLTYTAPE
jgi:hypothetical protein